MKKGLLIYVLIAALGLNTLSAQKKNRKNKKAKTEAAAPDKKKDKDAIKKYSEVITKAAVTDSGL
jgi:hypothetical protein